VKERTTSTAIERAEPAAVALPVADLLAGWVAVLLVSLQVFCFVAVVAGVVLGALC
jgi:hypothetical protein